MHPTLRILAIAAMAAPIVLTNLPAVHAQAEAISTLEGIAGSMPARVLSVVSGGFWQAPIDGDQAARGYYRIIALRSEDNTSRLYLQRIRMSEGGPVLVDSVEVAELTALRAYITDMRPEDSTGQAAQPGFGAFIYLKRDPAVVEPQTFELFVNDFGALSFEPAAN